MKTLLISCDYYLPGYNAGGPISTLSSLAVAIRERCRVFILTSDRDYLDKKPYCAIDRNSWNDLGGYKVMYLDRNAMSLRKISAIVSEVNPDAIYLNSVFSYAFSIRFLLARRLGLIKVRRWVLCPRGELNGAALGKSLWKKRLLLTMQGLFGLDNQLVWQATNGHELARVHQVIGLGAQVVQVNNLSRFVDEDGASRLMKKSPGYLRIVFVARINPHKNLMLLLDAMMHLQGNVELKIYGPVDDPAYWEACTKKITGLPIGVRAEYLGARSREDIIEAMRWAHALVLPSRSENFGQVIYESLSVGTPVIISDKTPWSGLFERGVGWDCDIESSEAVKRALSEMILMDETNWVEMVSKSRAFARESVTHDRIVKDMMKLLFDLQ